MNLSQAVQMVLLALMFGNLSCFAQQHAVNDLQSALARFEEHRAQLLSYTARVIVVDIREERIDDFLNRSLNRKIYEIAADLTADSMLICRNDFPYDAKASSNNRTSVMLKHRHHLFLGSGSQLKLVDAPHSAVGFFDPTIIGLGFCAELRHFVPYGDVLGNIRLWNTRGWQRYDGQDEQVTFGVRAANGKFSQQMTVSPNQGFAPVAVYFADAKALSVRCSYKEHEGIWLPHLANYYCGPQNSLVVEVEWLSVNQPIPRELFEPEIVRRITGLKVENEDESLLDDFLEALLKQ